MCVCVSVPGRSWLSRRVLDYGAVSDVKRPQNVQKEEVEQNKARRLDFVSESPELSISQNLFDDLDLRERRFGKHTSIHHHSVEKRDTTV